MFKEYEGVRLLKLSHVAFHVKAPEWAIMLEDGFKKANYRQLECI